MNWITRKNIFINLDKISCFYAGQTSYGGYYINFYVDETENFMAQFNFDTKEDWGNYIDFLHEKIFK